MAEHRKVQFVPGLERLESKQLLSGAGARAAAVAKVAEAKATPAVAIGEVTPAASDPKPTFGFLVYRITNPNRFNNSLNPPFQHVLVQSRRPKPGEVYNVLYVVVRNGTAQTFDANSEFSVRFPNRREPFPILTGTQQWKPGERFVFYVLTKKYYPLPSQVHSGFEFSLAGARSVAIPGPSGIFLRVKYRPATFDATLDKIVAFGPGNQGGKGAKYGLPNTATYEFVSSRTDRLDFGGYF